MVFSFSAILLLSHLSFVGKSHDGFQDEGLEYEMMNGLLGHTIVIKGWVNLSVSKGPLLVHELVG